MEDEPQLEGSEPVSRGTTSATAPQRILPSLKSSHQRQRLALAGRPEPRVRAASREDPNGTATTPTTRFDPKVTSTPDILTDRDNPGVRSMEVGSTWKAWR